MELKKGFIIGVVFAILGFTISLQYNTSVKSMNGDTSLVQTSQNLINELKILRENKKLLNEELIDLNSRIEKYETHESNEKPIVRNLKNDIIQQELFIGYREGTGPGIIITIDNPSSYDTLYKEEDVGDHSYDFLLNLILDLINVLNISGAEAISINDQRYISTTEIYYRYNIIQINSVPVKLPLTIKVIGNSEILEEALNIKYGFIWRVNEYSNLKIDLKKETDITIPKYNKIIQYKYAKPIQVDK